MNEAKIIERLKSLGMKELETIDHLNELPGDYINLLSQLPNGTMAKLLDDKKTYLACQIEKEGSDRCYGIAADESQVVVYEYGCDGKNAIVVAWIRL